MLALGERRWIEGAICSVVSHFSWVRDSYNEWLVEPLGFPQVLFHPCLWVSLPFFPFLGPQFGQNASCSCPKSIKAQRAPLDYSTPDPNPTPSLRRTFPVSKLGVH